MYRASSSVGVVGLQGPGAPYTAIVVEELIPLGARRFVIVGLAGSLRSDLPIGSFVVCSRAMRDEGTSHHYQRPSPYAPVSRRLAAAIKAELRRESIPFFEGPSWTTDAPYRETAAEVRRYRRDGILTVEMEAAAMFTVARRRGAEAAALFVISDLLDERGWEPQFHETREPLHRGLEIAIRACGR